MTEIIISILAVVLLIKAVKLTFKITWGLAKIIATILLISAIPIFIACLVLAGGFLLLIPVGLIAAAIGVIKLLT